jgi:hypothetical protein
MINLASLASEFTFFSPSYPVRGLMVDTSINLSRCQQCPFGTAMGRQPAISPPQAVYPGDDETVTPVTTGATHCVYSCPKIQIGEKLSIIE